jgi:predicted dehydrogenase
MSKPVSRLERVRVGVVGVGDFGLLHARTAARLPEVELCGVADLDAARAAAAGVGLGCPAHGSLEALLDNERPDAVIVATPEAHHLAALRAGLEAGAHVLIEKPVALSAADAQAARDLAAASGLVVMPGHVSRFLPEVDGLRRMLAGQRLRAVTAARSVPRERLDLHGRVHPALMAMVHDLDLVRSVQPAELISVTAEQRWTDPGRPYPQLLWATLGFDDGCVAVVENTWTLPHARRYVDARLRVTTDELVAEVRLPAEGLRLARDDGDHVPDTQLDAWVGELPVGAIATQLRHFAGCVRAGTPSPLVSMDDAVWSVATAERIIRSADSQPHSEPPVRTRR